MSELIPATSKIKLQLFLSRNGACSRRKALELIQKGHVTVNGRKVDEPSMQIIADQDKVTLDGKEVSSKKYAYILLNKPKGFVTTVADRHAQKTVMDILPQPWRHLNPAGRLDKDTEGLLLLTNDGDSAYKLTHPKFNVDKIYYVEIEGRLREDHKTELEEGILIEGKKTSPARISQIKHSGEMTSLEITIHEGRKRQIRVMFAKIGYKVVYLKRLAQGPLKLGSLRKGQWRPLSPREIDDLKKIK